MSRKISVEEMTRVEGHGGIEVILNGKKVESVKFQIFEGPRFFEHLIRGLHYEKIPDVTRRICGICTASHSLVSIGAIENAFNVKVTPQTKLLRDLLIHGEAIESHALHVFMLALPDFLGYPDAIRMASEHSDAVKMALDLKKVGNMIHTTLSGREVHGMNERVGGFSRVPSELQLTEVRNELLKVVPVTELGVKLLAGVELPRYAESENLLMAIDSGPRFGYIGDHILTSKGDRFPESEYASLTNEIVVDHSYAKLSGYFGSSFMVGALPRIILSGDKLEGEALELFKQHKNLVKAGNSLSNNLCQALELVHDVQRAIKDIDELMSLGLEQENLSEYEVYKTRGIKAIEAPRGLLYHDYNFDSEGIVTKANIITPTAQSAANIEKDAKVIAENLNSENDKIIKNALEIMIRAYDPCISCSVHLTRAK
jgi:sulfhydrogenase subunit alpha